MASKLGAAPGAFVLGPMAAGVRFTGTPRGMVIECYAASYPVRELLELPSPNSSMRISVSGPSRKKDRDRYGSRNSQLRPRESDEHRGYRKR